MTAQDRRTFDESGHVTNSLAEYPQAARDVASANHIAMIDLTAMSKVLYEAMGPSEPKITRTDADRLAIVKQMIARDQLLNLWWKL
jgi:hypothetical protein